MGTQSGGIPAAGSASAWLGHLAQDAQGPRKASRKAPRKAARKAAHKAHTGPALQKGELTGGRCPPDRPPAGVYIYRLRAPRPRAQDIMTPRSHKVRALGTDRDWELGRGVGRGCWLRPRSR